jgi:tetratricopeptide (TPR) repeat protein
MATDTASTASKGEPARHRQWHGLRRAGAALATLVLSLSTSTLGTAGEAERQGEAAAVTLDELERRVAADPDDLRAGAEYRQRCIAEEVYDRCIDFFAALAGAHRSHALHLNWGYAYVDKIPAAGAVTQVLLADNALRRFTRALEIEESWLGLYTRGNSYVYWPPIFGRTKLGIADLEKSVAMSEALEGGAPPYHAHAYAALGDAHWRLGDLETARSWWRRGLDRFPADAGLARRLELEGEALDEHLDAVYALGQRIDTSLAELWEAR